MCSAASFTIVVGLPAMRGFTPAPGLEWSALATRDGTSASATTGPAARMTPRSTALRSSRTFPGQAYPGTGLPIANLIDGTSHTILIIESIDDFYSMWVFGSQVTS